MIFYVYSSTFHGISRNAEEYQMEYRHRYCARGIPKWNQLECNRNYRHDLYSTVWVYSALVSKWYSMVFSRIVRTGIPETSWNNIFRYDIPIISHDCLKVSSDGACNMSVITSWLCMPATVQLRLPSASVLQHFLSLPVHRRADPFAS